MSFTPATRRAPTREEIRGRGINLAADAVAQSADHVRSFFIMLRLEEANAPDTLTALESFRSLGAVAPEPAATDRWLRAAITRRRISDVAHRLRCPARASSTGPPARPFTPHGWLMGLTNAVLRLRGHCEWRGTVLAGLRLLELSLLLHLRFDVSKRDALA